MEKNLSILLAGSSWGQNFGGVEKGPEAVLTRGNLEKKISKLGWNINEIKQCFFAR